MSDGLLVVLSPSSLACRPLLTEALEQLIACAEQGARPDAVLHDIRALLRDHGLLRRGGGEAG